MKCTFSSTPADEFSYLSLDNFGPVVSTHRAEGGLSSGFTAQRKNEIMGKSGASMHDDARDEIGWDEMKLKRMKRRKNSDRITISLCHPQESMCSATARRHLTSEQTPQSVLAWSWSYERRKPHRLASYCQRVKDVSPSDQLGLDLLCV
jgi:hypothetical protein